MSCYNFISLLHKASIELDLRDYQYVALSDQDDVWLADKLVSGIECLKSCKTLYRSERWIFVKSK